MDRPQKQTSEKPKKRHCSLCKREVYQTVHTANSHWTDWYGTELKPVCVDCYK